MLSFLAPSRGAWSPVAATFAAALISSACTAPPSPPAAPPPAASSPSVPSAPSPSGAPDASSAARPADAPVAAHIVHYDLVLARTEGATTNRASFSLDLSDAAPAAVTIAKNMSLSPAARADVGAHVKARLTMQGTTPRLDVDVDSSSVDATGKVRHATLQGAAPTPAGAATVLLDATDNGAQVRLTATPSAVVTLDGAADPPSAAYDLDVVVVHTGPGAPAKPTALTVKLAGDAPATARVGETVSLSPGDAGATARQDVGTRIRVTGHGRGTNLELDFDVETSAVEAATPAARIRKITSRGHLVAPFDKETVAFAGEDDAHRYVVKLTPHRAKTP